MLLHQGNAYIFLHTAYHVLQSVQWSVLEKLHCLVLQTAAVTSTVVLVFYWSVNSEAAIWGPYPDGYLKHAANAPIMLLDVWFSKVPFASYHLQVSIPSSHLQSVSLYYTWHITTDIHMLCYGNVLPESLLPVIVNARVHA